MWPSTKKRKIYTVKDWSNELLKFSVLLLTINIFFLWYLNREGWGINFTLRSEFDPTHTLWRFFFKYYYPFIVGSIPYAFVLIICSLYLRKFKNWARILLIPLSVLAGLSVTVLYIFLLKEFIFWPLYWGFVIVVLITLFWTWKYIFELIRFLRSRIVTGLFE